MIFMRSNVTWHLTTLNWDMTCVSRRPTTFLWLLDLNQSSDNRIIISFACVFLLKIEHFVECLFHQYVNNHPRVRSSQVARHRMSKHHDSKPLAKSKKKKTGCGLTLRYECEHGYISHEFCALISHADVTSNNNVNDPPEHRVIIALDEHVSKNV